jgi:hypothetical protein
MVMLASMYIQLNRTFHQLSENSESDYSSNRLSFMGIEPLRWHELLQERRAVLLSEAGSGKTLEIRQISRQLRSSGKYAFFIRLEHVSRDFESAFEEGTFEGFERWLNSDDEAWILLDSVDEARLRDPSDFESAVRKIGRRLTSARQRVHVVITGRSSAWRPKSDLDLCKQHMPFVKPSKSVDPNQLTNDREELVPVETDFANGNETAFMIVSIDDLTPIQVELFAKAKGVSNANAFLDAIERADAWSFTSRPQDLEELIEFWKTNLRIGSRLELMRNSIDRRLNERDQNRADARPLSSEKARYGARLVAGASTMAHEPTIQVPDGANNTKGLHVKSILSDWNDLDCATLLARPIFDEAIYGAVRFHHRSVREYLTAEWFAELLKQETSRLKIEELFFREQYGLEVVVPVLRPILPWLAVLDEKISKRIQRVAPEVLFEGGDPSYLPLNTRRQILHDVCDRLASGVSNRSIADYAAIQRFANTDLTHDVKQLINKFTGNDDLLSFLLRMVWQGELIGALPESKRAALAPSSGRYARVAAFRVLSVLGSAEDKIEIRQSFLNESVSLNRELTAEILKVTDPTPEAVDWLFAALQKTEDKISSGSIDELSRQLYEFIERADGALLPSMVEELSILFGQPPVVERRDCEVSARYAWIAKSTALTIERLIKARAPVALSPSALAILHKLAVAPQIESANFNVKQVSLADLVHDWPVLNMALFWYAVEHARKFLDSETNERLTDWRSVGIGGTYVQFDASDFENALNEVAKRTFIDDRLVALSLAFSLYKWTTGPTVKLRQMLEKAVSGDEVLSERLAELLHPPVKSPAEKKQESEIAKWKKQSARRKRKENDDRKGWHKYLTENTEKLRAPDLTTPQEISNAWLYLFNQMREGQQGSSNGSKRDWRSLEGEFGVEVARAFRDGVVAYWRRNRPQLLSEGAPGDSRLYSTILGLLGLAIEAREVENWPDTLNESEVEVAFRYAMHELNGFPLWLPRLFAKFPDLITHLALQEIAYELSIDDEKKDTHYLLADVSWSGEWLWDAVAANLFTRIESTEPKNLNNLDYALNVIQGSSITDDQIILLAAAKSKLHIEPETSARWFAVWVGVEPIKAIATLDKRLAETVGDESRTKIAMIFVTQLLGSTRNRVSHARKAYRTAEHLKSLYMLMHRHIKLNEDIDRTGQGVYSPGLRDNAQEARNRLFALLTDIPGKASYVALEEISNLHPDAGSRPWIKLQAKKRAELDAGNAPWSIEEVRDFNDQLERVPKNHRDLFDLAVMRLLDLKLDLENGDSSTASILQDTNQEVKIRKYIGNWCREKAHGRYSIPQEEELADAKKPDFRFHRPEINGPVPVELKLADNWSGPQLFERLEVQLCGDYLRDVRSGRGILLLVYRGDKKTWQMPNRGGDVNFEQLIEELQTYWLQISPNYSRVDEIRVIGIDLTMRSLPPSSQT